jgi:response regulator RpfG family c-di-GMP phosphodiesterase
VRKRARSYSETTTRSHPDGYSVANHGGYTATRRIKADPAVQSIPIIAVSSYALNGEEKIARAAGCDDYVPKPLQSARTPGKNPTASVLEVR